MTTRTCTNCVCENAEGVLMAKKIFLDDVRMPPDSSWHLFTSTNALIDYLTDFIGDVSHLSLDHDMGEGNEDAYKVVCWIEEYSHFNPNAHIPFIKIHSMNPVGAMRMKLVADKLNNRDVNNENLF